jgi:hypothetical protein
LTFGCGTLLGGLRGRLQLVCVIKIHFFVVTISISSELLNANSQRRNFIQNSAERQKNTRIVDQWQVTGRITKQCSTFNGTVSKVP